MADFDFGDGLRKVFLAGVGAFQTLGLFLIAPGIIALIAPSGGKALNAELKHKVAEVKESSEAKAAEETKEAEPEAKAE